MMGTKPLSEIKDWQQWQAPSVVLEILPEDKMSSTEVGHWKRPHVFKSKNPSAADRMREFGVPKNIGNLKLDQMSTEQLLLTAHSYLDNIDVICERHLRMGKLGFGGWEVCDDPDVRPKPPCVTYSYGISNDFSFDDDVARIYGCRVFSFDPSMLKSPMMENRSELVQFHRVGLYGKTFVNSKNWPLYRRSDLRSMLGHQNTVIDIIKMDIESSEWPALPEMVASRQFDGVKQFLVEYHVTSANRGYLFSCLKTIQMIEKEGFKKFYVHKNPACIVRYQAFPVIRTMCYEVHYIRR